MKAIITASLLLGLGATGAHAASVTLYNGAAGTLPGAQGYLAPGALLSTGAPTVPSQTLVPGGVQVITNANGAEYSGYSNYNPLTSSFVNGAFPALNRTLGYTISFTMALNSSTNNATNRAGFNVLAVSSDPSYLGIEIGFKPGSVFAQTSTFSSAPLVSAALNTSNPTNYDLTVSGNSFQLSANGSQVLSGALQAYAFNPATSLPPLLFNPYTVSNFLFFGDNTGQESATFTLNSAVVTTNTAAAGVPFGFSPTLGLVLLGVGAGVYQWMQQRSNQT